MKKEKEFIKRNFTPEEIVEKANDLAGENQRKARLESEKKSAMSSFKSRIDEVDARIEQLSQDITNGYCNEWVMCDVAFNMPQKGFKTITRPDTGEIVRVSPMTDEDFQTEMEFEKTEKVDGEVVGEGEKPALPGPVENEEPCDADEDAEDESEDGEDNGEDEEEE